MSTPPMESAGPPPIGVARFVFEKREDGAVEVFLQDSFCTGFLAGGHDIANWALSEIGCDEQVKEAAKDLEPGLYEMVCSVGYEYDPGISTPNGPAEPDAHWWPEDSKFLKLTEEQAGIFRGP